MGYEVIIVDETAQQHWNHVIHHAEEHLKRKFENPHIEKLWRDKLGHHDFLYCAHIKTGHFGNHHHFTVVWEFRGAHGHGIAKIISAEEGHKTLF
jgi:hypothetical protein